MCGLCGILGRGEHWAERPTGDEGSTRRRQRLERVRLINRVLGHYGLRVDDWQGTSMILSSRTGASEIVDDLAALWPAAARLVGRRLDPLDPALVARLEDGGATPS